MQVIARTAGTVSAADSAAAAPRNLLSSFTSALDRWLHFISV